MRLALAFFLAAVLLAFPAEARLKTGPIDAGSGHRLKSLTVQEGMATSLAAAYSFRKVRSAYAGPAVKLRRMDTLALTPDIGFLASGEFDTATAAAACAGTTCQIETWYDQSGNGRHAARAGADAADYVADCVGGRPCVRTNTNTDFYLLSASVAWAAAKTTLSAVAKRTSGAGSCTFVGKGNYTNVLQSNAVANQWLVSDNAVNSFPLAAADGAWHAGIGVIDGAASLGRIDGTELAGANVPGVSTAGSTLLAYGGAGTVCDMTEAFIWDNYVVTLAERQALTENQRNYWAPLPLDTFATPAAAYSMRRLKSSYTGPAIRLRRASDNAETDINFLSFTGFTGAPIDTAAANAHCAATTCSIVAWYDQSGNARHALLQGAEVPPAYVANCNGSLPCARTTGDQRLYTSGTITPTYPVTLGAVANRSAGGGNCFVPNHYGSSYLSAWGAVPNQWVLVGNAAGAVGAGAADAGWHAGVGVVNGASSTLRIDGAETAGSTTGAVAASVVIPLWGSPDTTCNAAEVLVWNTYALTATERAALTANQRNFWAIP